MTQEELRDKSPEQVDTEVGFRYYRYNEKNELNVIRILGYKNQEIIKYKRDMKNGRPTTPDKIGRMSLEQLHQDWTRLNADGIISFLVVSISMYKATPIDDVIVTIHRMNDIQSANFVPYAFCRQNIVNTFSTAIMQTKDDYTVGMTMSVESCPEGMNYEQLMGCDKILRHFRINTYCEDNLEDLLELVKPSIIRECDRTIYNLWKDAINRYNGPNKAVIASQDNYRGYCKSLRGLLTNTEFMYDYERAFGITKIKKLVCEDHIVKGTLYDGFMMDKEAMDMIQKIYNIRFQSVIFLLYDHDVRLEDLKDQELLFKDETNTLFICNYIKLE